MALKNCPSCDREVKPGEDECACGLVLSKWEAKKAAAASGEQPVVTATKASSSGGGVGWLTILIVAAAMYGGLKLLDKAASATDEQMARVSRPAASDREAASPAPAPPRSGGGDLADKSTEELLRMLQDDELKNPPFYELRRRGAKAEAAVVVHEMLRDKARAVGGEPPQQLKTFLEQLSASILNDYYITGVYPRPAVPGFKLVEWSIEVRDGALRYGAVLHIGTDIAEGFARQPREEEADFTVLASYRVVAEGKTLPAPVEKEVEIAKRAGIAKWKDEPLLAELAPGEYTVTLRTRLQYVDEAGKGKIINETSRPLRVVVR